jgi:hypothetical protein
VLPDMKKSLARKTPKGAHQVYSKDNKIPKIVQVKYCCYLKESTMFALKDITILKKDVVLTTTTNST